MGYSMSQEQHDKIERNRRMGRLCSGGRHFCVTPATRRVTSWTWTHKIGEGKAHESELLLCTRHARTYSVGFEGVNFIVKSIDVLPKPASFEVVGEIVVIHVK